MYLHIVFLEFLLELCKENLGTEEKMFWKLWKILLLFRCYNSHRFGRKWLRLCRLLVSCFTRSIATCLANAFNYTKPGACFNCDFAELLTTKNHVLGD